MTNLINFLKMKYEQFIMRESIRLGFIDDDNKLMEENMKLLGENIKLDERNHELEDKLMDLDREYNRAYFELLDLSERYDKLSQES